MQKGKQKKTVPGNKENEKKLLKEGLGYLMLKQAWGPLSMVWHFQVARHIGLSILCGILLSHLSITCYNDTTFS